MKLKSLSKFKPILGVCSQGQQRLGVDEGAYHLYNNVFKDVLEEKPYVIAKD